MVKKISDILKEKDKVFSFEFFPPKTKKSEKKLYKDLESLLELKPDFTSVTYGTGRSSKEGRTTRIVENIQKRFNIPAMHHLTCINHPIDELRQIIDTLQEKKIRNVLALYGDIPEGLLNFEPPKDTLDYCYQLCQMLRSYDDYFSVGVAGFPEGHVDAPDKETDLKYLKIKLDSGAQFVITQFFFNNEDYFDYIKRAHQIGIKQKIIPGIFPITDYSKVIKFSKKMGATVTDNIHDIFRSIADDKEATYR
jgi:methylenetetrahydrofolate reductase (NADPH)